MFRRTFILMILAATFLSGYYLGMQPGSPDVFAAARDGYKRAGEIGQTLKAATDGEGFEALKGLTNSPPPGRSGTVPAERDVRARPEVVGDVEIH